MRDQLDRLVDHGCIHIEVRARANLRSQLRETQALVLHAVDQFGAREAGGGGVEVDEIVSGVCTDNPGIFARPSANLMALA